jgi:hypothetical protein
MSGWEPGLTEDANKKFQWMTRGENCPLCQAMAGRVYYLHVFIDSTVYPGFHPNCNCYLKEVDISIPQSDLDIFGSQFNIHYDGWLEALFGNTANLWWGYNVALTRNIMQYSQPGMTASQSIQAMQSAYKPGLFGNKAFFPIGGTSWNVFSTARPDVYKSVDQLFTSWAGLAPKPALCAPKLPTQTYHNPIYNLDIRGW